MATTNFQGPVTIGKNNAGNTLLNSAAYVPGKRVVNLSQASPSASILTPPKSVVTKLGFVPTSAFTGTDPVSAMSVTFANGTVTLGVVTASAATRYHETAVVSGAVFDTTATLTVTLSAVSTTVFTGGGGRAFVDIITVE